MSKSEPSLTKYPTASFRELTFLSIPLILSLFSASFMGFCDRLFLAHYSLEALTASVSASYLCMLFQHPFMRMTAMGQVFVGLYIGSKKSEQIGACIWQMIWLSILSMIISFPLSQIAVPLYYSGTAIEEPATIYFSTLMAVNFLFPLGIALSSFFIGLGKMKIIFWTTVFSHLFNIILDYLLIFGIKGVTPSLGIFGAALATGISQGCFCLILLVLFLRKSERAIYQTTKFRFNLPIILNHLRVGSPRVIARIIILTAWVATAHIMTLKDGDYLMVLSFGGTFILLFTFINDGMGQAMITIASNLMGSKDYGKIWKMTRSAGIFLAITTSLLSIPYLLFPNLTLSLFFAELPSEETLQLLKHSCIWLWFFFFCYGFHSIGLSLLTAARDVNFYLLTIIFVWFSTYIPVYFAMNFWNWNPDKLWLIMACDSFIFGTIFLLRATKENWKELEPTIKKPLTS